MQIDVVPSAGRASHKNLNSHEFLQHRTTTMGCRRKNKGETINSETTSNTSNNTSQYIFKCLQLEVEVNTLWAPSTTADMPNKMVYFQTINARSGREQDFRQVRQK
jgi:hypothetical protein